MAMNIDEISLSFWSKCTVQQLHLYRQEGLKGLIKLINNHSAVINNSNEEMKWLDVCVWTCEGEEGTSWRHHSAHGQGIIAKRIKRNIHQSVGLHSSILECDDVPTFRF